MRLFVLTLAASAFVQPALAHEHVRSHHRHGGLHQARYQPWSTGGAVYARHRGWERVLPATAAVADERRPSFDARQSEYRPYPGRYAAPGDAMRSDGGRFARRETGHGELDAMIAHHAQMNGVPEALVHRVVIRESRYNPRAINHGALGLMQIKYATARAMGYTGSPAGLLDPETNLTYAVRYLAGAYRVAGGNANRAVANYARGYYGAAKRAGVSPYAAPADRWAGSYASAQPVQEVMWSGAPLRRHYGGRRLRTSY
jgi:soluble lytic murein transglycosylase-like protein